MQGRIRQRAGIGALVLLVGGVLALAGPPDDKGKPPDEAGNNLSYPVIWAEGVAKTLMGAPESAPVLEGNWWYWWGTEGSDPNIVPLSCPPDPDDEAYCDNEATGSVGDPPGGVIPPPPEVVKAFLQKDSGNVWQARSWPLDEAGLPYRPGMAVNVDRIDWGDNLESVDWYTRSQVRTEVVLFEDGAAGVGDVEEHEWPLDPEYGMRHVDGWGINEVHGLAASLDEVPVPELGPATRATVYSHCARLTIQKLLYDREVPPAELTWVPEEGWTTPEGHPASLVNAPIFNKAVYEGGDGPGYYSAEINVKGRVIYGYTWNVRQLNDMAPVPPRYTEPTAAGDYRITFSFDAFCDGAATIPLNAFFVDGVTEILVPVEETVEAEPEGGGAVGVLRTDLNLTYMDVRILERSGGKPDKVK